MAFYSAPSTQTQKEAFKAAEDGHLGLLKEMLAKTDVVKGHNTFVSQLRGRRWSEMDGHDRQSVDLLYVNAARGGHPDTLRFLLDHYPYESTWLLGNFAFSEAIVQGSLETVRLILDRWPDLVNANKPSSQGLPMEYALTSSWPELATLLTKHGAEPLPLEKELQLLPRAARDGRLEAVSRLVDKGADLETNTLDGPYSGTALLNAILGHHVHVAEYLILAGADLGRRSHSGRSMLQVAAGSSASKEEMVQLLRGYGARE